MKRLRHPIRAVREPFGTAGLVVACIALISALGGTALAAKGALTGKEKKEVTKIAKKYAGKPGAPGAAGPAGKDGTNGTNGSNGKDGTNGSPGAPGAEGKSVELTEIDTELPECEEQGGVEVKVEGEASGQEVCNGAEGSPWTDGGTLPPGAVETGTYYGTREAGGEYVVAPISFSIPLAQRIQPAQVFYGFGTNRETGTEFNEHCPGEDWKQPLVQNAGELCVYQDEIGSTATGFEGIRSSAVGGFAGTTFVGGFLRWYVEENLVGSGSWAVKGCNPAALPDKCPES